MSKYTYRHRQTACMFVGRMSHTCPSNLKNMRSKHAIGVYYSYVTHTLVTILSQTCNALFIQTHQYHSGATGVPGMVGGMLRHMKSLRSMSRDNGWIHTLLEEAENERMHLLTFLQLRQPGFVFRGLVLLSQVLPPLPLMSLLFFSCYSSSSSEAWCCTARFLLFIFSCHSSSFASSLLSSLFVSIMKI